MPGKTESFEAEPLTGAVYPAISVSPDGQFIEYGKAAPEIVPKAKI